MRLMLLCALALLLGACASQSRPNKVGEIGLNSAFERENQAELQARRHYDYVAPKAKAYISSQPIGALVEWMNSKGEWVAVGNTPTRDVVIEATGKPELFRVSAVGFLPQQKYVAATTGSKEVRVSFELEPDMDAQRAVGSGAR